MHDPTAGELTLTALQTYAHTVLLGDSDLDDDVHTVASGLASDANNGGVDDQVEFLHRHLGASSTRELLERYDDPSRRATSSDRSGALQVALTSDDLYDLGAGHTITTLATTGAEVTVDGGDLTDDALESLRRGGSPVTVEVQLGSVRLDAELTTDGGGS